MHADDGSFAVWRADCDKMALETSTRRVFIVRTLGPHSLMHMWKCALEIMSYCSHLFSLNWLLWGFGQIAVILVFVLELTNRVLKS